MIPKAGRVSTAVVPSALSSIESDGATLVNRAWRTASSAFQTITSRLAYRIATVALVEPRRGANSVAATSEGCSKGTSSSGFPVWRRAEERTFPLETMEIRRRSVGSKANFRPEAGAFDSLERKYNCGTESTDNAVLRASARLVSAGAALESNPKR